MGKTAFTGPVFGAISNLWNVAVQQPSNSTTAITLKGIVVPPGQDWYVTSFHGHRGNSTHSTATVLSLVDDSTTIATVALTSSLANVSGSTRLTPDSGEYQGVRVAAESSLTITLHNGGSSVASSMVYADVYGYIRWIPSTTYTE